MEVVQEYPPSQMSKKIFVSPLLFIIIYCYKFNGMLNILSKVCNTKKKYISIYRYRIQLYISLVILENLGITNKILST